MTRTFKKCFIKEYGILLLLLFFFISNLKLHYFFIGIRKVFRFQRGTGNESRKSKEDRQYNGERTRGSVSGRNLCRSPVILFCRNFIQNLSYELPNKFQLTLPNGFTEEFFNWPITNKNGLWRP